VKAVPSRAWPGLRHRATSAAATAASDGLPRRSRIPFAHARRQFVDVAENFPDECRFVLEMPGQVCLHDAEARERILTPAGSRG